MPRNTRTGGKRPFAARGRSPEELRRRLLRLEQLLLAASAVCLGYVGWGLLEASLYQAHENQQLDAILRSVSITAPAPDATTPAGSVRPAPAPGSTLGRVEIPRLGVSAIVRAGVDARTLQLAVGHIPGTALPGEPGNIGVAAHRDTFFRRLGEIEPDDEIRIVTRDAAHVYRVERTMVVQPRDVWVLDPTPDDVLTLVTCYPFTYFGAAPERFIVRAVRTGSGPAVP